MSIKNQPQSVKYVLTPEEKNRLSKTRANKKEVRSEVENIISKHQNAIKNLSKR